MIQVLYISARVTLHYRAFNGASGFPALEKECKKK